MFGTTIHILYSFDPFSIILNVLFFIYFVVLITLYNKFSKDPKKEKIWKKLCFIPLVISIIHIIIFVSGSAFFTILLEYIYIYISSLLIALLPLLIKKRIIYNVSKIIIIMACIYFSIVSLDSDKITNYTRKSLRNSYISLCDNFEKNYIMNDWKKIDYKKLKNDGLVLIEEAEQTGNIDKYYEALEDFVNAHNDGHMGLSFNNNDYILKKIQNYNDYGLSLLTLDDGNTIAVDVDENLDIKSGDIITKWDGIPIKDAVKNVKTPIHEGISENDEITKTFYLSAVGGDTVDVTYVNSNNEEVTTTLKKLDSEMPRAMKSYNTFNHSHDDKPYDYKMLNDNTGYLKIGVEETNAINDYIAYYTDDHKAAREKFRNSLRELRNNGMKKLVIDIRNNGGGYDEISTALASLFSKEKKYAFSLGYRLNNKNNSLVDHYVLKDGEFSDIKVVVLTNMRCASAGDGIVLYLSRIDGITIAGLTDPEGVNQETGGVVYMPKGAVINYPVGLILDQDGNPNIDIDDSRTSRNPVDIKIPLTKENAIKIFDGEDYELEWAIDYLNK